MQINKSLLALLISVVVCKLFKQEDLKMKLLIIFLAFLIIFCCSSESALQGVALDCKFKFDSDFGYQCDVTNSILIALKKEREILKVSENHKNGKLNGDVTSFHSHSQKIKFFPQSLTKFFNNIEYVDVVEAELEEISKEDLRQFGDKLKHLGLDYNKIQFIEGDLFSYNKNLKEIYFHNNKLVYIGNNLVQGLNSLRKISFEANPCTTMVDFASEASKIPALMSKVEASCKDENISNLIEIKKLNAEYFRLKEKIKELRERKCGKIK